ncbi:MAG: PD-(D/E)XK nuclease family protein, partial [Lachnospiraceae bacterium]|nr:PD-(D/E)XK nuclease family protein [Lachnospiraceae bacterium]
MRERIILAPGVNGSGLTQSLASHGVNSFNLRIVGVGELARIALMRSGMAITGEILSDREETTVIAEAVKGEEYFENATYSDIQEIAKAVRKMRTLVAEGNEAEKLEEILGKGIFQKKNTALLSVYGKYMQLLKDRNLTDAVSIVRKALEHAGPMDADFYTLKEFPLHPLAKALLAKLSGGAFKETDLAEFFGVSKESIRICDFRNCYGAPNEVEQILTEIYSGRRLDRTTVAVADLATYGQLFFDYALLFDLPITFGCGIPISNSNPAKLMVLYYRWMTGGFFGAAALHDMLSGNTFDRSKLYELYPEKDEDFHWNTFTEVAGALRLTNDAGINEKRIADFKKALAEEEALFADEKTDADSKSYRALLDKKKCIPYLEVLAKELALPAEDFIQKYSFIRKGFGSNSGRLLMALDQASLSTICDELRIIRASGVTQATDDMIRNVLKLSVGASNCEEGALYVTEMEDALTSVREDLYIAGLSASKYPGSPVEDYLLLDHDLEAFGAGADYLRSEDRIAQKRETLLTLARLATGLGSKIHVSFAGLNVSELKKDNASSLIFELYREEHGENVTSKELEEHITGVAYFEPAIAVTRKVGEAYSEGKLVMPRAVGTRIPTAVRPDPEREYSPSALEIFFNCPRAFLLRSELGIPEPEEDKPFEVIDAKHFGTLAHEMMELLGGSGLGLEDYLKACSEAFDRYLAEHPPLVAKNAAA